MSLITWISKQIAKGNKKVDLKYVVVHPFNTRTKRTPTYHTGITRKNKTESKKNRVLSAKSRAINRGNPNGKKKRTVRENR